MSIVHDVYEYVSMSNSPLLAMLFWLLVIAAILVWPRISYLASCVFTGTSKYVLGQLGLFRRPRSRHSTVISRWFDLDILQVPGSHVQK